MNVTCSSCKLELALDKFAFKNKEKGVFKNICKECHSKYRRQHYLRNKDKYISKARIWNKKQGEILSNYLFRVLSLSRCVDCGEKDIVVLDFDHLENKKLGIAEMYRNRYSVAAVKKEIEKCVVRCANCHRRKTARDLGSWKFRFSEI